MNSVDYDKLVKVYLDAENILETEGNVDAHPKLRKILREIAPARTKIKGTPFKYVPAPQLLEAIKFEVGLAIKKIPGIHNPYKEIEKQFRINGKLSNLSECIDAGALDFVVISDRYRTTGMLPTFITCILPPIGCMRRDEILGSLPLEDILITESTPKTCPQSAGFFASTFAPLGIYCIKDKPGYYILPGALGSPEEQAFWARRILRTYTEPPNRRNIDAFIDPDYSNIEWAVQYNQKLKLEDPKLLSVVESTDLKPELKIVSVSDDSLQEQGGVEGSRLVPPTPENAQKLIDTSSVLMKPVFREQIWDEYVTWCANTIRSGHTTTPTSATGAASPSAGRKSSREDESNTLTPTPITTTPTPTIHMDSPPNNMRPVFRDLSWATLGYQYDWTDRQYHLPTDQDYAQHISTHGVSGTSAAPGAPGVPGAPCSVFEDPPSHPHRWYNHFPPLLSAWGTKLIHMLSSVAEQSFGIGELGEKEDDPEEDAGAGVPSQSAPEAALRTVQGVDLAELSTVVGSSTPPCQRRTRKLRKYTDLNGLPMALLPQAGIANFYQCGDKLPMGGHVDDMERTMDHPVLSISLGCSCVFLLGGDLKEDKPYPILLHSGDAMILSGGVRQAFHGVPRVFQDSTDQAVLDSFRVDVVGSTDSTLPKCGRCNTHSVWAEHTSKADILDDSYDRAVQREFHANLPGCVCEEFAFQYYLKNARINLNVRQVR